MVWGALNVALLLDFLSLRSGGCVAGTLRAEACRAHPRQEEW